MDTGSVLRLGALSKAYLETDLATYLKEEVQEEGLVSKLDEFARFLEAASYLRGGILNVSRVAEDCSIGIRPSGTLDSDAEINGEALETLVLQELKSISFSHRTLQAVRYSYSITQPRRASRCETSSRGRKPH